MKLDYDYEYGSPGLWFWRNQRNGFPQWCMSMSDGDQIARFLEAGCDIVLSHPRRCEIWQPTIVRESQWVEES